MIATSDHQPFLFGHTGYWSKIFMADRHVAMFDVPYRQEDHLNSGVIFGQTVRAPLVRGKDSIADLEFVDLKAVLKTMEQLLMAKKNRHRQRLDRVMHIMTIAADRKWNYADTWVAMAEEIRRALGHETEILESVKPVTGPTTFSRNVDRITREASDTQIYLCGPSVESYRAPGEHSPWPVLVHRMENPSPKAFLEVMVTEDSPWDALEDYDLKTMP